MTDSTRNVLIACGVLLILACSCVVLIGIAGSTLIISERSVIVEESATIISPAIVEPTSDDTLEEVPVATPTGEQEGELEPNVTQESLGVELEKEMDQIQQEVIALRGWQPDREVERSLLTPDELRERVVNDFLEDYSDEDAAEDVVVMSAFDLLDPDFDLIEFYIELFSEQIAGFYDDESEEMYVVRGSGFQGPERLTYAHEYVHVLQDQNYDIEHGLNYSDELCETDSERCAAIQALLEGDASLLELVWFSSYATDDDRREILSFYDQFKSPIYDSAPDFMKQDFLFPYQAGQEFVQYLFDKGEWDAVNEAYEDLPVTTEQILHPERYPNEMPVPVDLPEFSELTGNGWKELDRGVMGEWSTYLILGYGQDVRARLSDQDARSAADGWGGDMYVVLIDNEGNTVMVLRTVWDTLDEANEFRSNFEDYAESRFGKAIISQADQTEWQDQQGYVEFHQEEAITTWVSAPDAEMSDAIWNLISQVP